MTNFTSRKPSKLAMILLSLAMTVSFISCASVQWQSPNSADSPLIINAGSYCLPVTILGDSMFPWPMKLKSNDTRFGFQSGFVITYQATYANDIMGCPGDVAPGLYVINFTLDNASWSGPGLMYIQVSSVPVELFIDPLVTINSGSAPGPTFNLVSLSPWADMTITPSLSNNQFTVSPTSITFRPNSTATGFTFTTNGNTKSNSSVTVTYTLSGTNKATYSLTQSTGVVNVPGGSNQTTNTTTNNTGGTNTTTNNTGGTNTTTNTTTNNTNNNNGGTNTTNNNTGSTNTTNSTGGTNTTNNNTGGTNNTNNNSGNTNTTNNNTGGTNTTTNTTNNNTSSTTAKTTLTASDSNITIIAGTHTLPLTLTTTGSSFKSNLWCTASLPGFRFNPQLVVNSGAISGSGYLGASSDIAAGNYNVTFWCNDTQYTSPVPFRVKVTKGQVKIPRPETLTVRFVNGFTASSTPVTIDLSDSAPFQDLTITPVFSDNNWTAFPPQITFSGATKTGSFVYQVKPSASGSFTTTVTFRISGSNAASYAFAGTGTQTIKGVGKAN